MGNFSQKVDKFIDIFLNQNGYVKVVQGLHNTLLIAICGLIIGIVIGTLIATVRVIPKYKTLPRVLNHICSFLEVFTSIPFPSAITVCDMLPPLKSLILKWGLLAQWLY